MRICEILIPVFETEETFCVEANQHSWFHVFRKGVIRQKQRRSTERSRNKCIVCLFQANVSFQDSKLNVYIKGWIHGSLSGNKLWAALSRPRKLVFPNYVLLTIDKYEVSDHCGTWMLLSCTNSMNNCVNLKLSVNCKQVPRT